MVVAVVVAAEVILVVRLISLIYQYSHWTWFYVKVDMGVVEVTKEEEATTEEVKVAEGMEADIKGEVVGIKVSGVQLFLDVLLTLRRQGGYSGGGGTGYNY